MKTKLVSLLLILIVFGGAYAYLQLLVPSTMSQHVSLKTKQGFTSFPDITFSDASDRTFTVRDIPSETVLVHLWAAWCGVCLSELPDLLRYVAHSHGKVALLSVSLDDDYKDTQKVLDKIAAKYHFSLHETNMFWAWDKDKTISAKLLNTVKVPETIILNNKRDMIEKIIGPAPWAEASTKP